MLLRLALCLVTLSALSWAERRCCPNVGCFDDRPPFGHLPLPQCSDVVKPTFTLHTRSNRRGVRISRGKIPSIFNPRHQTVLLIHGYQNEGTTSWLPGTRDRLLNRGNYNVIITDWKNGASTLWYPQAASNTRLVGKEASLLMQALATRGHPRSRMWCVGHSLGGHTCGHIGKNFKLGRITGLDPAGPMFENYPNAAGLTRTDADFVDVIHTMGDKGFIMDFGTLKPLGHADFYPNGGKIQPGCINYLMNKEQLTMGLLHKGEVQGEIVGCSHGRACTYFMESIQSRCSFISTSVCSNERNLPGSCRGCGSGCQRMGFYASPRKPAGKFYLTTNSAAPFCKR